MSNAHLAIPSGTTTDVANTYTPSTYKSTRRRHSLLVITATLGFVSVCDGIRFHRVLVDVGQFNAQKVSRFCHSPASCSGVILCAVAKDIETMSLVARRQAGGAVVPMVGATNSVHLTDWRLQVPIQR